MGQPGIREWGNVSYLGVTEVHVSLGSFNGAVLVDPHGVIEAPGRRCARSSWVGINDLLDARFGAWVEESVELNRGGQ